MKEIGGYFELELSSSEQSLFPDNAVYVNSGRNALRYILLSIPCIDTLWIPYYTCNSIHNSLKLLDLNVKYYHINSHLEIENISILESLGNNDYFLYTNYFGIKDEYINKILKINNQLIIDNSQSLYSKPTKYSFYSPRKFIGVPDGGVAFSPYSYVLKDIDTESYKRFIHLLKRYDHSASKGYDEFKKNGELMSKLPLQRMSNLTKKLIESIDFENIKTKRNINFNFLHQRLSVINEISIENPEKLSPLVYPLKTTNTELRNYLISKKVYVAKYWPNMQPNKVEHFANSIIAIPIDQRYNKYDMNYILKLIYK